YKGVRCFLPFAPWGRGAVAGEPQAPRVPHSSGVPNRSLDGLATTSPFDRITNVKALAAFGSPVWNRRDVPFFAGDDVRVPRPARCLQDESAVPRALPGAMLLLPRTISAAEEVLPPVVMQAPDAPGVGETDRTPEVAMAGAGPLGGSSLTVPPTI